MKTSNDHHEGMARFIQYAVMVMLYFITLGILAIGLFSLLLNS